MDDAALQLAGYQVTHDGEAEARCLLDVESLRQPTPVVTHRHGQLAPLVGEGDANAPDR